MARDIDKDLTNLLKDCYVWNKIAEESDEKRLDIIYNLAMLAGDLVSGGNFGVAEGTPGDEMSYCTTKLADIASKLVEKIEGLVDETV